MGEEWVDPDDAPELGEHFFKHAAHMRNGVVIREATGTLTRVGRPKSSERKELVSLRLHPTVVARFRATGKGWQTRMGEALREAAMRLEPGTAE